MTRYTFGGYGGDQVAQDPALNAGVYKSAASLAATGTFWSARTGGAQYTDLIDPVTTVALTGVSTDSHGSPVPFMGPNGITEGWLDFGGGRFKVTATEGEDGRVAALVSTAATAVDTALGARYARLPKTGKNALTGWFHADGYGFATANSTGANDTALANAHTDMSNGDTLYIPAAGAAYQFSTWTPTKTIRVLGGFSHMRNQVGFGNATWTNGSAIGSGLVAGTILQSTATSAVAINLTANGDLNGFGLENVVLIGPGSGTSTGMSIGPATSGGGFPVRTKLRNVAVANFSTGIAASCENSQWDAVYIVGCPTGLATAFPFNGNTINGLNIEVTTVAALSMVASDANKFNGGVIQGNTGEGIYMAGCWGNDLFFYVENTAASGTQNDVHLTTDAGTGLASCDNKIGGFWASHSTGSPQFLIDASCRRNTFYGCGPHFTVKNNVVNAGVNNNFLMYIVGTVTDTGRNNAYPDDGAFTGTYLPIFSTATTGGTVAVNDNLWHLTGSAMTTHLPDPTTMRPGKVLIVKNATANTNNVVDSAGTSKTIDGAASVTLAAWQSLRVYSNGTNWFTV